MSKILNVSKDSLRVERSTTKLLERCTKLLERNLLIPRSSDAKLVYFREKFNLIEFV